VIGVNPKAPLARLDKHGKAPTPGERDIFFEGKTLRAKVFEREELPVGFGFDGPAIVEQYDTTVFVTPGFRVKVDSHGNLIGEAINGD
jgi:N-methylhydantoinase A